MADEIDWRLSVGELVGNQRHHSDLLDRCH